MSQLLIQSLAIIALIIWGTSYHFKYRKTILLVQLASFVFWIIHFLFLGATTGAVLAGVAALRLAVFSFKTKNNWIDSSFVKWFFILLLITSTYFTFSSYSALFALIGGIFAVLASWQYDENSIRKLFIPSHIGWIIYDIFIGSYGGAISEGILGISALISLVRKDLKK